jgi:uncharacterized membrane protein
MLELERARGTEAWRWTRLAKITSGLGLIGGVAGWSLAVKAVVNSAFLTQNSVFQSERLTIVRAIGAGIGLMLLLVLGALAWKRWRALDLLERIAVALAPLAVLAFLPVLLQPSAWFRNALPFLALLSGLVLVLERVLRPWLSAAFAIFEPLVPAPGARLPGVVSRHWPLAIVTLAASGFAAFVYYYSLQQHQRLATSAFDLGIYDNLMYVALKGHPFRSTVLLGPDGPSYLVGHAEFAMLLFVPLYWLWPTAEMLLMLQAIAIGFAAVPLYFFARTQLSRSAAMVIALAYLLYAPLHGSCFYDFHWLPVTIFFQFTLYFALATHRTWLFIACYALLTLLREDVSVGLTMLGLFLLFSGIRPKLGLTMAICSAVSFVGIKFGIMLYAGPFHFPSLIYGQLVAAGENDFGSVVRTLVTNPAYVISTLLDPKKLNYFLHLMAPLVFLPLRHRWLWLLISGGVVFTFLTTAYEPTISINFQYPSHWIPYLFAAVVLILGHLSKLPDGTIRRRAALGALLFGVTVHSYVFGAILQHETYIGGFLPVPYKITASEKDQYAKLKKVVSLIPRTASVAATDREVPHISNRYSAYTLRIHHGDSDYLLINQTGVAPDVRNIVQNALSRNDYGYVTKEGPFYLFKRGHVSSETEKAFKTLGLRSREGQRR